MSARVAALSVLGVGGVLFTLWASSMSGCHEGGSAALRAEIAAAVGGLLPVEGRPTGGFRRTEPPSKATISNAKLKELQDQIEAALAKKRSPQSLADAALLKRFAGKQDEAIALLQEAVALTPQKATYLNDLAAVFLSRSLSRGPVDELPDVARALSYVDRCLEIAPDLAEARFNKAIALERLHLLPEARSAWRDYLRYDSGSDWKKEARARLANLEQEGEDELWSRARSSLREATLAGNSGAVEAVVRRFPFQSQVYVEESLFGDWGKARRSRRPAEAQVLLQLCREIGRALERIAGEGLIQDSVDAIDRATSPGAATELISSLEEGHQAYQAGLSIYESEGAEFARPYFEKAEVELRRGRSPFYLLASLRLAICRYRFSDYAGAIGTLAAVQRARGSDLYRNLAARCFWMAGLCHQRMAEPVTALASYEKALAILQAMGAVEGVATIHQYFSETYRYLGNTRQAWKHRRLALAGCSKILDRDRRYTLFNEMANAVMEIGEPRAASYFRDAVVRTAREANDFEGLAFGLLRRAETRFELMRYSPAIEDLTEARSMAARVESSTARESVLARIQMVEGSVLLHVDAESALRSISDALAYCRRTGNDFLLISLYLTRSKVLRKQGLLDEALADLRSAVEEYRKQVSLVSEDRLRLAYLRHSREAVEELVGLEIDKGNSLQALSHTEDWKASLLQDRFSSEGSDERKGGAGGSLQRQGIFRQVTGSTVLIEYFVLPDRLIAWVVADGEIKMFSQAIASEALDEITGRVRNKMEGDKDAGAELRWLHEVLIHPLRSEVSPGDFLVIVPDKDLYSVPFSALIDPGSKRYLIEDHPIIVSPSAELYFRAARRERNLRREGDLRALVVGDPDLRRSVFASLADLTGARAEAIGIADLYPPAAVERLLGARATEVGLLASVDSYDVIHLGVHALVSYESPWDSRLVLAPGSDGDGLLHAHELSRRRFKRPRLVILASCRSGEASVGSADGLMSLGWAFLGAEIPVVIANLWDIDDRGSALLLTSLHRNLLAGFDPAQALQHAQIELVRGSHGHPAGLPRWSGFQVFGGVVVNSAGKLGRDQEQW